MCIEVALPGVRNPLWNYFSGEAEGLYDMAGLKTQTAARQHMETEIISYVR